MAVVKMQQISICGLNKNRSHIMELLQLQGVVEIKEESYEGSVFQKKDLTQEKVEAAENIALANKALEILESYSNEKQPFLAGMHGRTKAASNDIEDFSGKYDRVMDAISQINSLEKTVADGRAEISKLKTRLEALSYWKELDIPMDFKGTRCTAAFIGALPGRWSEKAIFEQMSGYEPIAVDIINTSQEQTGIFLICMKDAANDVREVLRRIGFSLPGLDFSQNPADMINTMEAEISYRSEVAKRAEEKIRSYLGIRGKICFLVDVETMKAERLDALGRLLSSRRAFILTGYIPAKHARALSNMLTERFDVAVDVTEAAEAEDVPVLLENNEFAAPVEGVVEIFSPPGKGEIDPSLTVAIFFYMFYGLMLSDAGYGIILVLFCAYTLSSKNAMLEESARKFFKMFLYCGISAMFWGIMFGSYFGDLIGIIARTFLGREASIRPVLFSPTEAPLRLLGYCMLLGIIHLYVGMGIKLYQSVKRKDYKTALYDVLFWYVLLSSLGLIVASLQMTQSVLGLDFAIPSATLNTASVLALLSAAGIVLTNGRESKNPFVRILRGLYGLYGVTSYLGDLLSYTRLLALGLATGIIGSVINLMAGMAAGNKAIGAIPFALIVVFGHALNLAINMIGAYVHTTRLQYVEYFNKFYRGGGRKFQPFSAKTKYYNFKGNDDDE